MKRLLGMTAATLLVFGGTALADPIERNFQMPSGYHAKIAPCGGQFCITYTNGPYNGKTFGKFKATGGGNYSGSITDYTDEQKEYKGKAKLKGNDVGVSGCVLFGLACREQVFKRL